ncbi:hypothetical protein [Salibacterium aidingense]|uniref:hypothetical protein n=1 Tax=Salibacterium aidingense TaxID=384933 RepID=UPI003BC7DCAE
MMSSNGINTGRIIGRLFLYKCKSYSQMLMSLLALQLLAIILSTVNSTSMSSVGGAGVRMHVNYYSADFVMVFTIMWGCISAVLITTKINREDDFLFVTNRFTSHISSVLYLFAVSVTGGVTAALSSFLVRVLSYYRESSTDILGQLAAPDISVFAMGTVSTILFVLLFTSAGYLAGIIMQWHRFLQLLLPAAVIGFLILMGNSKWIEQLHAFFYLESSFPLFIGKTLGAFLLMSLLAVGIANRMEVKQ